MKIKILIYPYLESLFEVIIQLSETLRQRFAICRDCGQNRYTGKSCVK